MQGRLCDPVDGKIQAFPWQNWKNEFAEAALIDVHLLEWTLDQDKLYKNPLMTAEGRKEIIKLSKEYDIVIPSLTGDCFMQQPFWKIKGTNARQNLQSDFLEIVKSCSLVGIRMIVVPLVDNGRLESTDQQNILLDFLLENKKFFFSQNLQIIFESDFEPDKLSHLFRLLPGSQFGINYDIGNSAANGFDPIVEFREYGSRIVNVHIKDRIANGSTVKLKTGDANFDLVFSELSKQDYKGNLILQTARAVQGNHSEVLKEYRDLTTNWIEKSGLYCK